MLPAVRAGPLVPCPSSRRPTFNFDGITTVANFIDIPTTDYSDVSISRILNIADKTLFFAFDGCVEFEKVPNGGTGGDEDSDGGDGEDTGGDNGDIGGVTGGDGDNNSTADSGSVDGGIGQQSMGMMKSDTRRKLGSVSRGGRFRGVK